MTEQPTLRRDAERNRQRILDAAREVFAERGLGVSLDEIARAAGVGVGTVYRRFGSKDALIEELFESRLAELHAIADEALARERAWDGLVFFLESLLDLQRADRGFKQLALAGGPQRLGAIREALVPRVESLLRRAQADGELRPDVGNTDFPMIGGVMLGAILDATRDVAPELWRRYLAIVLDGLRISRDAPSPLPVAPLALDQVDEVMHNIGS